MKLSQVPPPISDPKGPTTHPQKNDDPRITPEMRKAAQQLESIFTGEMMKAMRKTVEPSEFSLHNGATDIYQGMLDEEYSDMSAQHKSLGLSEQIIDYWLRSQPEPKYNKDRNPQPKPAIAERTGGTHEDQSSE